MKHLAVLVVFDLGQIGFEDLAIADYALQHVSDIYFLEVVRVEHPVLGYELVQSTLLDRLYQDVLLDRVLRN